MLPLSFFSFLMYSALSVIVFYLPLYLEFRGLHTDKVGIVVAAGSFISIFAQPYWGYLSDKKKTVKTILMITLAGSLLTSFGLFSARTFLLYVLLNLLFFFFQSAVVPLTDSLTLSYAQQNNRNYGSFRLFGEAGVGVSTLLVGMLMTAVGMSHLWTVFTLLMLLTIASGFFLADTRAVQAPINLRALGQLFRRADLLWFFLLVLIVAIPHRMNDSMLSMYLSSMNATKTQFGLAWTVATFSTVPVLFMSGKLIRRFGELPVFTFAAIAYMIRWTIYSLAGSPSALIAGQLLHSLSFPLFLVSSIHYLAKIVPPEMRSTGQSAYAVVFGGLAGIIGSAGGGAVIQTFGPHTAYGIGGLFALLGAAAAYGTIHYNRKNGERYSALRLPSASASSEQISRAE